MFIEGTLSFRVTYGTKTRYIAISVELERKITAIDYHAGIELREKWEQFTHEMVKKIPTGNAEFISSYHVHVLLFY